jgi:hypothetical protein
MKENNYTYKLGPLNLIIKVLPFFLIFLRPNYSPAQWNAASISPAVNNEQAATAGKLLHKTDNSAKISSFTGSASNGQYLLSWETVIEENVRQYDVEYSTNNKDFQRAGIVPAKNKNQYMFSHVIKASPAMFYRLKVVDNTGASVYTHAILVNNALARNADEISPSIIRDGMLNLTLANSYRNLQVFNSAGVEVFRENLGGRTGNRIGLSLPSLPAGAYFVKLIGTGVSLTKKVMIM